MLDTLARNAFLSLPAANKIYGGDATSRVTLEATDYFDPDMAEIARVHLEENEIPGAVNPLDSSGASIIAITTPRVIYDIRTAAGSDWKDVQLYEQTGRKFSNEVGMWAGVRFLRTNRLRLHNAGVVAVQTTLSAAITAGEGAAATVDVVYSPGQSTATRYITVTDETGFAVGDYITVHSDAVVASGEAPIESDGTQETRRIVSIDTVNNRIAVNKPFLKNHDNGDYVTKGVDVHATVFVGGPGVVYGVGEAPHVIQPPKYDDLMMVNRIGWRGFLKFQMFRPEYFEVAETAGSLV